MNFDEEYTKYWSSAVNKSVDGTIIAGVNEVRQILKYLELERSDLVLDLGCSFGRMHEALSDYSNTIYGIDVDSYAVKKASLQPYVDVCVGSAEQTDFDRKFFDAVFCWAVFDVVDHKKGLAEMNRILKNNGKLLLTGKNDNYSLDDNLAYKAEKNAFLKEYPNRFTDLNAVLLNIKTLGFKLDKLLIFPNRGDMGLLKYIDQGDEIKDDYVGYEYLIICHKIAEQNINALEDITLEGSTSKTAMTMATQAGFAGVKEFFKSIGVD